MNKEEILNEFIRFIDNPPPKSYNQNIMFNEIWEERKKDGCHRSELTNEPLLNELNYKWHWQFLHVLGKQAYPSMKLFKPNIILALPTEHEKQESFSVFKHHQEVLKQVYYQVIHNKQF